MLAHVRIHVQHRIAPGGGALRLDGGDDGVLHRLHIKRIAQVRPVQLHRSACELRQDQRPGTIRVARDVFLGHQVHAVLKWRDQHDVGGGIVTAELGL